MKSLQVLLLWVVTCVSTPVLAICGFDSPNTFDYLKSPVCTKANRVFVPGMAAALLLTTGNSDLPNDTRRRVQADDELGQSSDVGNWIGLGLLNGSYIAINYWRESLDVNYKAHMMMVSSLYSLGSTMLLKFIVRERRPGPDKYNSLDKYSFPSGHASMSFTFATNIALYHEWYYGIPAFGLAGFISFSRINDDAHWLHDIVGGAALGAGFALGIYYVEQERKKNESESKKKLLQVEAILPQVTPETIGIQALMTF